MSVTIRNAASSDCEKIRPLQKEIADLHHAGRPDLFQTQARYFTQADFDARLADPNHFVYIAENEGEVVGYAFAWIIPYRNHSTYIDFDCFYIDDICVLQKCRRQGIGKALFTRCKEQAKRSGCKMMDLGVWSFNKDAIKFYESCGMTERIRRMQYRLEESEC